MKETSPDPVADRARRKATPPQTLFPDFPTAHSAIMSRPAEEHQRMVAPGIWETDQSCPPTSMLPSTPHFQSSVTRRDTSNVAQARHSNIAEFEASSNMAGMSLQEGDIEMRPLNPRRDIPVLRVGNQPQSKTASEPTNNHTDSAVEFPVPDLMRNNLRRRPDTISDILSNYDDSHRQLRRSQNFDSSSTAASVRGGPINFQSGDHLSFGGRKASATVSLDLNPVEASSASTGVAPSRQSSQIAASFGFNDLSGKELKRRFASAVSPKEEEVVKISAQQNDGGNDYHDIESGPPSRKHRNQTSRAQQYRPVSFGESTESLLSSSPENLSEGDEQDIKCEVSFSGSAHRLSDHIQPPVRTTQPLTGSSKHGLSPLPETRELSTDADWETIEEQDSKRTSIQDAHGDYQQPGLSSLRHAESELFNEQAQSLWSPLKTVKGTTDLQALLKQAQRRHHSQEHPLQATILANESNVARASNTQNNSAAALLPHKNTELDLNISPIVSTSGPSTRRQTFSPKPLFPRKQLPSPALQSSSLFAQNNYDSSELDREINNNTNKSKMDKGKGRAMDLDSDSTYQNYLEHHTNTNQDIGPEFNYDDMFEDIVDDDFDDNWKPPQFPITESHKKEFPPVSAQQDATTSKTNQTRKIVLPQPNVESSLAQNSVPAQDYGSASNSDVFAFLRATNPALIANQPTNQGLMGGDAGQSSNSRQDVRSRPAMQTIDNLRSHGYGVEGFTGVELSNGARISRPERVIRNQTNLPAENTFGWYNRLPRLQPRCKEMAFRLRIDAANDEWNRLKHECPQFPLREDHLITPHPVKEGQMLGERLQMVEDGGWLEQAWCSYHNRAEFSATLGLTMHQVHPDLVAQQHKTGKLAVWLGCLVPFGGLLVLRDIRDDSGSAAELMRYLSGDMLINQPHEQERRLAGLFLEVMMIVWGGLLLGGFVWCLWALATGKW